MTIFFNTKINAAIIPTTTNNVTRLFSAPYFICNGSIIATNKSIISGAARMSDMFDSILTFIPFNACDVRYIKVAAIYETRVPAIQNIYFSLTYTLESIGRVIKKR